MSGKPSRDFRTRMPKEKPAEGTAFVVFSVKHYRGSRMEFEGIIDAEKIKDIMALLSIDDEDVKS